MGQPPEIAGDRNNIIELAQQIVLPPIRNCDTANHNTLAPQVSSRQKNLLTNDRRRTGIQSVGKI